MNADIDSRQKELDDAKEKLGELDEKLKPISELVEEAQKLVKDPVTVGADVEKGKEAKADADVSTLCLLVSFSCFEIYINEINSKQIN